ncbi:MAG: hypothetical protein IPG50_30035 [Myxococcales bacterium]|nr:hypothetical protein [Myxococcales bacterium]
MLPAHLRHGLQLQLGRWSVHWLRAAERPLSVWLPDLSEPATLETAPNAYQLHGVDAGILLASRSFEHVYDFGANPHADFAIRYGDPVTPFRHDTSELTMQALVRVPTSAPSGGGAGQIAFVVSLRDTTTGEGVTFVAKIWDSRPASGGALDAMGDRANNVTTVRTSLAAGARYATVSPFSNVTRHEQPWSSLDFFRVHFSGA